MILNLIDWVHHTALWACPSSSSAVLWGMRETLAKEVAVFLVPLLAVLLLVTYIPGLVLFLPRLVMP